MDLVKRKRIRLPNADYSSIGTCFLTICTKDRQCLLSRIVGTGVLDGPRVGTGVPDGPRVGTGVLDGPRVGTGVPDGPRVGTGVPNGPRVGTGVPDGPRVGTGVPNGPSVGTGVPDGPRVGTGVPNGPSVGTGVLDGPSVGTGVPDGPEIQLTQYGKIASKYINQLNHFYTNISVEHYVIMPNHIHMLISIKDSGPSRTPVPTKQNSVISRFVSTLKRFCNKEYGRNIWQYRSNDHIIRSREDYEKHVRYIYENPIRWRYDELYCEEL